MKAKFKMLIATLLVGGLLFGTPLKSVAQDPRDVIIPSLQLDQADIRDALKILFKAVNVSYSINADVQGSVTAALTNVPFETALRNVLGQVEATWRVEGGIYVIIKKVEPTTGTDTNPDLTTTTTATENAVRRIKIRSADPFVIIQLLNGTFDPFMQPEVSTNVGGGGGGFGGGGQGGLGGGGFGGGGLGGGGLGGGGFGGGGLGGGGFGGFGGGGLGGGGFGGGGLGGGGGSRGAF